MVILLSVFDDIRISDKINTKSIAYDLKMLSVNQINAPVKLTEMWKALNVQDYPINLVKKVPIKDNMHTRSTIGGDLVLQGKNELCNSSFILAASKNWNSAPNTIKECTSIYKAKSEIKKFVFTLPL